MYYYSVCDNIIYYVSDLPWTVNYKYHRHGIKSPHAVEIKNEVDDDVSIIEVYRETPGR